MTSQPLMEGGRDFSATDSDSLSRLKWTKGGISTVIHVVQGTMFNNKMFWLQRGLLLLLQSDHCYLPVSH